MNETKIRYLEMIQNVMSRMASNSFTLKGWTVTLLVGIFTLTGDRKSILIAYVPIILFWFLDSYYLQLERKYRILYQKVVEKEGEEFNFYMDPSLVDISINESKKLCYLSCFLSHTELWYYFPCVIVVTMIILLI